jgi:hypothetical protein
MSDSEKSDSNKIEGIIDLLHQGMVAEAERRLVQLHADLQVDHSAEGRAEREEKRKQVWDDVGGWEGHCYLACLRSVLDILSDEGGIPREKWRSLINTAIANAIEAMERPPGPKVWKGLQKNWTLLTSLKPPNLRADATAKEKANHLRYTAVVVTMGTVLEELVRGDWSFQVSTSLKR